MNISKDADLTKINSFGVQAKAKYLAEIENENDLKEVFDSDEFKNNQKLFLGGGSNVLFVKDFDGIVILNKLKGIEIKEENEEYVILRAVGGEWWHDLVLFSVEHNFWGIENLALIPGTVGASPVQNIGAYGVELKDVLESVEAYNIANGEMKIFSKAECEFGYRESVFKNKFKGQYFISAITLKLNKKAKENTNYQALSEYLKNNNKIIKTSKDVSDAISAIRKSKLPDPKELGSAGSFFKNIYVDEDKFQELKKEFPSMPSFKEGELVKIPSGWLIEACEWKGKKIGNVGVHDKQALVLVNHGGATGAEVLSLANEIIDSVYKKFGLKLTPEVNILI